MRSASTYISLCIQAKRFNDYISLYTGEALQRLRARELAPHHADVSGELPPTIIIIIILLLLLLLIIIISSRL